VGRLKLQGVSSRDGYNCRESVRGTVKTTGSQLAARLKLQSVNSRDGYNCRESFRRTVKTTGSRRHG